MYSDTHAQLFRVKATGNEEHPGFLVLSGLDDPEGLGPTCMQSCGGGEDAEYTACGEDYPQGVGALLGDCWGDNDLWSMASLIGDRDVFAFVPGERIWGVPGR